MKMKYVLWSNTKVGSSSFKSAITFERILAAFCKCESQSGKSFVKHCKLAKHYLFYTNHCNPDTGTQIELQGFWISIRFPRGRFVVVVVTIPLWPSSSSSWSFSAPVPVPSSCWLAASRSCWPCFIYDVVEVHYSNPAIASGYQVEDFYKEPAAPHHLLQRGTPHQYLIWQMTK